MIQNILHDTKQYNSDVLHGTDRYPFNKNMQMRKWIN